MLTKALSLLLVIFLGLALGLETARFVHAHTAGDVAGASSAVNIHRALLGFSLLATSGALLLSLRADRRGGLRLGAWLSRQWSCFTAWLELTLDGLFDFDALNVRDGLSSISISNATVRGDVVAGRLLIRKQGDSHLEQVAETRSMQIGHVLAPGLPDDGLLPCRGCSWCGVDPSDLPDELWTECDGSGRYLPNTEAERKRQLTHPKLPRRQAAPRPPPD